MKVVYCLSFLAAACSASLVRRDTVDTDDNTCQYLSDLGVAIVNPDYSICMTKYTEENPYNANEDMCNAIKSTN
ncbi:hypothetical protein H4S00_006328, partial [Coemansia sp. D1744]